MQAGSAAEEEHVVALRDIEQFLEELLSFFDDRGKLLATVRDFEDGETCTCEVVNGFGCFVNCVLA